MPIRTLNFYLLAALVFSAALPLMAAFAVADTGPVVTPVLAGQLDK